MPSIQLWVIKLTYFTTNVIVVTVLKVVTVAAVVTVVTVVTLVPNKLVHQKNYKQKLFFLITKKLFFIIKKKLVC